MKRILIANRGEIACRIIRSCKMLGIESIAVYSDVDVNALHVEIADEAHLIGSANARESYLRADKLLEVAKASDADGVHPGYGFHAENAQFAQAVQQAGMIWIGPNPSTIVDMGDKERARDIAKASGVPIVPGSARFLPGDLAGLDAAADEVGFPLLVKASAGGGGIGMRIVAEPEGLTKTVQATQSMAEKAFGDGAVFLERYIPRARHIEMQVFGFGDGSAIHLGERDCSIQRRFQKVIEESPAPAFPDEVRRKMAKAAIDLCHFNRYQGAGTVEFIVDVDTNEFYFLEMNTRIQVEHPVSEMVTGLDLVAMQIELACGALEPFDQSAIHQQGHAIECRIYAENPAKNFMPAPGKIELFDMSKLDEDARIDTGFRGGDEVTSFYDPMIAKLICHAPTRQEAIEKIIRNLSSLQLSGITTNVDFMIEVLKHSEFGDGHVFTGFINAFKTDLI
jgi:3-methylcrotonyl-CoA carboxylase alpha subunit